MGTVSEKIFLDLEAVVSKIQNTDNDKIELNNEQLNAIRKIFKDANLEYNPVIRRDLIVKIADNTKLVSVIHEARIALEGEDSSISRTDHMLRVPPILRDFLESIPENSRFSMDINQTYTEYENLSDNIKNYLQKSLRKFADMSPDSQEKIFNNFSILPEKLRSAVITACVNTFKLSHNNIILHKAVPFGYYLTYGKLDNSTNLPENYIKRMVKIHPYLKEIYIEKNPINLDGISEFKYLETISLIGNELDEIPEEIFKITNLKKLVLTTNSIDTIPNELLNLKNLQVLDLSENQLTAIPPEIGTLTSLREIYLNENQITELPDELFQLSELTQLRLKENQLTSLSTKIGNLTKLEGLNVSDNQITHLPQEIGKLKQLTYIGISDNHLTTLPSSIGNFDKLEEIHLLGNPYQILPKQIRNISLSLIIDSGAQEWEDYDFFLARYRFADGSISRTRNPKRKRTEEP